MDIRTDRQSSYYELVVVRAHVALDEIRYERVYVCTQMSPADLFTNYGKPLAGIRRVCSIRAITQQEYREARASGEHCFHARPRQTPTEQMLAQLEHRARTQRRRGSRMHRAL